MNRNLIGSFGFILLVAAILLPFLHLEQGKGDVLPLLMAVVSFLTGLGLLLHAIQPGVSKKYALIVCTVCTIAIVILTTLSFIRSNVEPKISFQSAANRTVEHP